MKKSNFHLSQIFLFHPMHFSPTFLVSSHLLFSVWCTLSDPHPLHSHLFPLPSAHLAFLLCVFNSPRLPTCITIIAKLIHPGKHLKADTPKLSLNSHFLPLALCLRAKGFVETRPACLLPELWTCGIFQAQVYWAPDPLWTEIRISCIKRAMFSSI